MEPESLNPQLTISFADKMCCCLPLSVKEPCRCGVDYDNVEDEAIFGQV